MAGPQVKRGDIWPIDLGLAQKSRPAMVISIAFEDHERALVTYIPRTTSRRQSRFEVVHEARGFCPGVFDAQSIGTIPVVKLIRRIGILDPQTLRNVESAARLWPSL